VGALLAGILADLLNISWAIGVVGALTFLSGVMVAALMRETLPAQHLSSVSSTAVLAPPDSTSGEQMPRRL
jgi:hypothetical protein